MSGAGTILRLDARRRRNAWLIRLGPAAARPRQLMTLVAALIVVAAAGVVGASVAVTLALVGGRQLEAAIGVVALTVAGGALLRLVFAISPDPAIDAFLQTDVPLLARAPITARDLILGRVVLHQMAWTTVGVVVVAAVLLIDALAVGLPPARLAPLGVAGLMWISTSLLALSVSAIAFAMILRLPSAWIGPATFASSMVIPVVGAALIAFVMRGPSTP